MNRNRVIGALAVLACCLTPLAACDDARSADTQGPTTAQKSEPEQKTQTEPEPQEEQEPEEQPTAADPQDIVDSLQVGSDGSTDTMDNVPQATCTTRGWNACRTTV